MASVQISELRAHVGHDRHPARLGRHDPVEREDRVRRPPRRLGLPPRRPVQEGSPRGVGRVRHADPGDQRGGDRGGAGGAALPGRRRAGGDRPRDPRRQPRLSRSRPRSTGPTSCSSTGTSGSAAGRQVAIARVRHEVEQAIRDFFYQRGFTLVDTPILTGAIGEEAGNLFATEYFDLGKAYLAQTGQLYVEAAAAALGQGLLLRPHVPRREVEDPPPPHRVLDGRAGGRLQRLRRQHAAAGGVRRPTSWRACSSGGARSSRSWSATPRRCERVQPPVPADLLHRRGREAQRQQGSDIEVGRRPRRRRRDAAGQGVRPAGLRLQLSEGR